MNKKIFENFSKAQAHFPMENSFILFLIIYTQLSSTCDGLIQLNK